MVLHITHAVVYQTFNSKEIMDSKLVTIPETDEESENAVPKAHENPSPVTAMGSLQVEDIQC